MPPKHKRLNKLFSYTQNTVGHKLEIGKISQFSYPFKNKVADNPRFHHKNMLQTNLKNLLLGPQLSWFK